MLNLHADQIAKLQALGADQVDALTEDVLASMPEWQRELLISTDPFESRLLRAAVLVRSTRRPPPPPTDDPQLRLVPWDGTPAAANGG